MNNITIDIPARLAHRPRDFRGYIIPFAQFIDKNGLPDFRIIDDEKVQRCLTHRLCGLCGEKMGQHIFFIGGDLCVANGFFHDPPMHRECAEYALRACPHLARIKGRYAPVPDASVVGDRRLVVGLSSTQKCETFALMEGRRYHVARDRKQMLLIRAVLPWCNITFYREGKPV